MEREKHERKCLSFQSQSMTYPTKNFGCAHQPRARAKKRRLALYKSERGGPGSRQASGASGADRRRARARARALSVEAKRYFSTLKNQTKKKFRHLEI